MDITFVDLFCGMGSFHYSFINLLKKIIKQLLRKYIDFFILNKNITYNDAAKLQNSYYFDWK